MEYLYSGIRYTRPTLKTILTSNKALTIEIVIVFSNDYNDNSKNAYFTKDYSWIQEEDKDCIGKVFFFITCFRLFGPTCPW